MKLCESSVSNLGIVRVGVWGLCFETGIVGPWCIGP